MKIVKTVLVVLALTLLGAMLAPNASANSILGTAGNFGVLAGSTVTNTGNTSVAVNGDLGISPGAALTGFPPGSVSGSTHLADAVAGQAQIDLTNAYVGLAALGSTSNLTGQDLGGQTLTSGVYFFSSTAQLTGNLVLDAQGKSNQFWVFQIGSTLTTASASSVTIINAGAGGNDGVFWQVGSSATLGTTTSFLGNILALSSITMNTGANISCGRALARNGAVTLDTNKISIGTAGNTGCSTISQGGSGGLSGGLVIGPGGGIVPVPESGTFLLVGCGMFCLIALSKLG